MTFLNNLPSTQLAARHNTLRDLRTIDDIVPRDLLDVEIRDRRPPPEPVRSVLQVVELPNQVDRSPLQNVSPQQKPEHSRYNSTGFNCNSNSNSMSFSISRSSRSNEANTVPVFQRQVSDFDEDTKNESLTLSQRNRYAQLRALIGNEGM